MGVGRTKARIPSQVPCSWGAQGGQGRSEPASALSLLSSSQMSIFSVLLTPSALSLPHLLANLPSPRCLPLPCSLDFTPSFLSLSPSLLFCLLSCPGAPSSICNPSLPAPPSSLSALAPGDLLLTLLLLTNYL